MVRVKIICARGQDDPQASCDAPRSSPDARAPASPTAEPLGSGPPSPTTPPSPRRYPAPRPPLSSGDSSRGTSWSSSSWSPSSWSSSSGSSVAGAPPAVRAASETLALVRALADKLEVERKKARAAERDARRERERREAAETRFDALSRLYVARFKEEVVPRDTGAARPIEGAPIRAREPSNVPTLPRARAERERVRTGKNGRFAPPAPRAVASAGSDDIDDIFREARELILAEHARCGAEDTLIRDGADEENERETALLEKRPLATAAETSPSVDSVFPDDADDDRPTSSSTTRRETVPGWRFTGIVRDTKFRKKCPMHEGPCADCEKTCRVPFRPTRAADGRDDPLCAKCLIERKERRKAATERDWNDAKNGGDAR